MVPRFILPRTGDRLHAVVVALAYFGCAATALQMTRFDGGVAIVWFAGSLLFSVFSVLPRRRWPGIALACCPAGAGAIALFGIGGTMTIPLTLIGIAEAWIAAWAMRRIAPRFHRFQSVNEAFRFLLVAGVLVPAASALPGAWCAHVARGMPYGLAWRDWFMAHALGFVAFSPPLMLTLRGGIGDWWSKANPREMGEAAVLLGAVALATTVTFGQNTIPLVVVPLVPMVAATFRLGRMGAVASVMILMAGGLGCTLAGRGPTALLHVDMVLRLEVLQIYFVSVVLILLPVAAELTARRRMFEQLRAAEALHRLIIERTSDIMMRLGRDGTVRYVSPAAWRVWGFRADELVGRSVGAMVHDDDADAVAEARDRALAHPDTTVAIEFRVIRKDGATVWVESHMCAATDSHGTASGIVTIIRDTTERRQMIDDLSRQATTDPLTGLCNRRVFDKALTQALGPDRPTEQPGCLAIFDLDHFKRINDAYGHATGDRILVLFSAVLRGAVRSGDVVARLGGEEFAVLLNGASVEQARLVCERIRVRLATSKGRSLAGEVVQATVSVGLAPLAAGASVVDATRAADEALYRAKHSGRNQLSIAA